MRAADMVAMGKLLGCCGFVLGIDLLTRRHRSCANVVCLEGWRGTPTNDARDVELNAIGVLKRREIEARILAPVVEILGCEFGREKVLQIVRETIVGIARDQGQAISADQHGAPDRARQSAGRRHHAGVLAGMGASTVLQLPDRRSRRGLARSAGA